MSCYDLYIENCLKLCLQDDYIDRRKLRAHNRAMDTLAKLEAELTAHELRQLLTHEDERVRLNGAAACLRRQLCMMRLWRHCGRSRRVPPMERWVWRRKCF